MKKIIFILAMLFCPNLFAATLTANNVPYVCQGGASPQLCNSNIITNSNGNIGIGTSIVGNALTVSGTVQASSFTGQGGAGLASAPDTSDFVPGTLYQATTGDIFVQCYSSYGGGAELAIQAGPSSTTLQNVAYAQSAAVGGQVVWGTLTALIPKNYYWKTASAGASPCGGGTGGSLIVTRIGS